MEEALQILKEDAVEFARLLLNFKPFTFQEKMLRDQSKRIVSCMGRQTGKTTTIAIKAIHFACSNDNVIVLITSPSLRQSMIMFDRILSFIYNSFYLPKGVVRKTRTIIQLSNGSQIIALPCSEKYLRGYTAHLVIMDEAAFMPEEVITQIVFPMLSTTNGSAIFLSTPWGKDHLFYRAFMDPKYSVHKVKSSECPLIKPEFLEEMKQNMTDQAYRMEYEAEFVEESSCYFPQDLIRSCVDPALKPISTLEEEILEGEYYSGCDFGKLQDYSVITVVNWNEDNLELVYLHEFPTETPYTEVIGHLVRAHRKFQFRNVQVDQTGVGEPVLEELKNQDTPTEGLVFTAKTKEELLSCLKIVMEQKRLRIPYNLHLCQQINEQKYAYTKTGHLQFSHPEGSHDDMLWSLALAVWAATMKREPQAKIVKAW
jgi:phage FluMu gp28-like protein